MPHPDLSVVTGAFSYTGQYVARRLLDQGVRVRTLARSLNRGDSFGGLVEADSLDFGDLDGLWVDAGSRRLIQHLYRVRYVRGRITFDLAVENTRTLFEAAKRAGVPRMVQFSVTNPSSRVRAALFQR